MVFNDAYTSDDQALRGYFRQLAIDMVRPMLAMVVDDMNELFSDDHKQCPDGSDCNTPQSACLNALVRFNDRERDYFARVYPVLFVRESSVRRSGIMSGV